LLKESQARLIRAKGGTMKEKLFSLISLGFLGVGFIVGVAGADKDGPKDLAHATDQLIQHVTYAREAEEINHPHTILVPSNDELTHKTVVVSREKTKKPAQN
jgi:hypothetical protein